MVPVAFFVYNRPQHTQRALDALKLNNIPLLYVFSDGPKTAADIPKVEEIRNIIDRIDWVEKKVIKEETNKGLANSIAAGVSRVIDEHNEIIVLEDDCVPAEDFYSYMCQCLEYYKNEESVYCISAFLNPIKNRAFRGYDYDVFFWGRFWSWGWATWRRAWKMYKHDVNVLADEAAAKKINLDRFGSDILPTIQRNRDKLADCWAINWFLVMVLNNAVSVFPVRSRVQNIGFDGTGVHCGVSVKYQTHISDASAVPLKFPPQVKEDRRIARVMLNFINRPTLREVLRKAIMYPLKLLR